MEGYFDIGINFIAWLQSNYHPELTQPMLWISELGRFEFYLAILTLIYWSLHKQHGRTLVYLVLLSAAINSLGKAVLRMPRPFWLDDAVGLSSELSYGMPSGHTQAAVTFVFFLAAISRRPIAFFFAFFYAFVMGMSHIYLGVHFVQDVLLGAFLGGLIVVGYAVWRRTIGRQFQERIFGQRLLIATLVPLGLLLVYGLVMRQLGKPDFTDPVTWKFLAEAEFAGQDAVIQGLAGMFGAGIGFLFEMNRVWFDVGGSWGKRLLRWVVGLAIAVAIWLGLAQLFDAIAPPDMRSAELILRFVRYGIVGLWISYFAPILFVFSGLAERSAEPETPYSIKATKIRTDRR